MNDENIKAFNNAKSAADRFLTGSAGADALYAGGTGRQEVEREFDNANKFAGRAGPNLNWSQANQAAGYQNRLFDGLAGAIRGDPNSVAQRALAANMQRSNATAMSAAAGQRGGMAARALANRTAANQVANNQGTAAINSQELMDRERIAAMSQAGGLAGAMASSGMKQAYGAADLDMRNNAGNLDAQLSALGRGLGAAEADMQGNIFRANAGRNAYGTSLGVSSATSAINSNQDAARLAGIVGGIQGGIAGAGSIAGNFAPKPGQPGQPGPISSNDTMNRGIYGSIGASYP